MSRAGRPQNPLPDGPAAAVSAELRRQREQAGLTYRDLADEAGYSLATVTAACGGRRLPSWKVTRACVAACGGDEDAMRSLYEQACTAEGRPVPEPPQAVTDPPDPAGAATAAELIACMKRLRTWAGSPSLAELNDRSRDHLPPSTVSGVLRRTSLPRRDLVARYAAACGLPESAVTEWENAWKHIKAPADTAERDADDGESPPEGQPDAGPAPPPARRRPLAAFVIANLVACLLNLVCFVLAASPSPAVPLTGLGMPEQAVPLTLQVTSPDYVFQGSLSRDDGRALARSIAGASAQPPQQARRTISTSSGAQVFVSNLLGAGGAQQGAFLEALDVDGSGTASATALTLGGLPAGTEVGLLTGAGRSLKSCSTARWFTASSMPLVLDSTVCIFRPATPGTASLLSVKQQSPRAIALDISSWYPEGRPGSAQSPAPGADLADSAP
jgi:transcriptional regulator with XRE-family HTH domain